MRIFSFFLIFLTIIISICSGNMGFFKKISWKKSTNNIQKIYIPLERRLTVNVHGKKQLEAFLALLTRPLGFMNCDTQQSPITKKFFTQYQKIKHGAATFLINLQQLFPVPHNPSGRDSFKTCTKYLNDPIFQDNEIKYPTQTSYAHIIEKTLYFDYFSKNEKTIAIIQCPIINRGVKDEIYFLPTGKAQTETIEPYFVLTKFSKEDPKLVIIMRTKVFYESEPDDGMPIIYNQSTDEVEKDGPIRLYVRRKRFKDKYRLFGKNAESAFILTEYGFWNPSLSTNIITRFIETTLAMSKGYEIIPRETVRSLETPRNHLCQKHIDGNILLQIYGITYVETGNKISTAKKTIKSFLSGIPNIQYRFLQCPVNGGTEDGFVYFIPIAYQPYANYKFYDLIFYTAKGGDWDGNEILLFSAPNESLENHTNDV